MEEGFCDHSIVEENYRQKNFHEMVIGEILEIVEPQKDCHN